MAVSTAASTVSDYGWRPVGTGQHKKHFAVAHAGFK
jgi:hypothetical protein